MNTDKIAALRRTALFGDLPEPELNALAECVIERRLKRDEILFVAGCLSTYGWFLAARGKLRLRFSNAISQSNSTP